MIKDKLRIGEGCEREHHHFKTQQNIGDPKIVNTKARQLILNAGML